MDFNIFLSFIIKHNLDERCWIIIFKYIFLYLRYMLDNLVYSLKFRKMISFLQKLSGMCVYLLFTDNICKNYKLF